MRLSIRDRVGRFVFIKETSGRVEEGNQTI